MTPIYSRGLLFGMCCAALAALSLAAFAAAHTDARAHAGSLVGSPTSRRPTPG